MTTTFDYITIKDISEQDEYQHHPDDDPIDISDKRYQIVTYEETGPYDEYSEHMLFATEITLNGGGNIDTDSRVGFESRDSTLERRDDVRDGLVDLQI